MDQAFKKKLIKYLKETLGVEAVLRPWAGVAGFPYLLRQSYDTAEFSMLNGRFLLLAERQAGQISPGVLEKHMRKAEELSGRRCIFGTTAMLGYNRKRLIERKIPFVLPGNQLYLPDLGIDLREHMKVVREKPDRLGPSAQLLLLAHLLRRPKVEAWTVTGLAEPLQTTPMTMSRAVNELKSLGLAETESAGREKFLRFIDDRKALWAKALPHLSSPVAERVYVENLEWAARHMAGLSALAEVSMLARPKRRVWAVSAKFLKALPFLVDLRIVPKESRDLAPFELEIWRYDPQILAVDGVVDPLSLYLSLQEVTDERVEAERETLLDVLG